MTISALGRSLSLLYVAALQLVVLHSVDGYEVAINPAHIVTLRQTAAEHGHANRLLAQGAHCVVGLLDRKFVAVTEPCSVVQRLLEEPK